MVFLSVSHSTIGVKRRRLISPRVIVPQNAGAVEDAGRQEVLNWFALAGAMEELGARLEWAEFVETHIFNSNKVFAVYSEAWRAQQRRPPETLAKLDMASHSIGDAGCPWPDRVLRCSAAHPG